MIRKYTSYIKYIVLFVALIFSVNTTTLAAGFSEIDFEKTGSVALILQQRDTHEVVPEVEFALYRVGDIDYSGNSFGFVYNKQFENSGMPLNDLQADGLAKHLAKYALKHKDIACDVQKTDSNGKILWSNLELGLYLVVQMKPVQDEYITEPFLVSVPICESNDEEWTYDVDASPKIGTLPDEDLETPPTPPVIQTGQLNWPIPLLAGTGVLVFTVGWVMTFMKRKHKDEK